MAKTLFYCVLLADRHHGFTEGVRGLLNMSRNGGSNCRSGVAAQGEVFGGSTVPNRSIAAYSRTQRQGRSISSRGWIAGGWQRQRC